MVRGPLCVLLVPRRNTSRVAAPTLSAGYYGEALRNMQKSLLIVDKKGLVFGGEDFAASYLSRATRQRQHERDFAPFPTIRPAVAVASKGPSLSHS